ncbi:MAG: DUF3558 domain-containing protein [Actinophytocola sp.]|uniref:DUF3558 family protein n=1 Tax=Actinophytocola sp. TaxID=1872138 RepID=UPI001324B309|nr:DUF3558 family protein [Actinophytocola sp.]MPZ80591.1 DUF3558 domain-containing protein [Actinophytocola sp.]
MRTLRIVLASLLLVAGCSSAEPGEPTVGDATTSTTTDRTDEPTGTSESTETGTSVDRPREIDLKAVDICQVVAKLPLKSYGLDGDRAPLGGDSTIFPGSKECFANGIEKNLSLTLVAVTNEGAESFVESANADITSGEAAGFPLAVLKLAQPANCFGVLDVHDGQFIYVSYGLSNPAEQPATPQDQLCRTVSTIATATIGALG